ncbi:hypothetical protein G7046_g1267 [Stylonectria norvegica]|nr:hypothetical protein G7046_g1267 [Stylonectria norvegica]
MASSVKSTAANYITVLRTYSSAVTPAVHEGPSSTQSRDELCSLMPKEFSVEVGVEGKHPGDDTRVVEHATYSGGNQIKLEEESGAATFSEGAASFHVDGMVLDKLRD